MSTIYNQNGEATTNDLICGNCKHYNKSTEQKTILGIIHACDKGFICNSWNFTGGCKFFEESISRKCYEIAKIIDTGYKEGD